MHHGGRNFLALTAIRKHMRDRTPPKNSAASAAAMAVGGAVGGAAGASLAVPVTLGIVNSLGFTSAGIAAGSTAAAMMSAEAVAAGGTILAGGQVATLQAVGAAGLMAGGPAFVAATVLLPAVACAAVGVGIGAAISRIRSRENRASGLEGGSQTGLVPGECMLATEEGASSTTPPEPRWIITTVATSWPWVPFASTRGTGRHPPMICHVKMVQHLLLQWLWEELREELWEEPLQCPSLWAS